MASPVASPVLAPVAEASPAAAAPTPRRRLLAKQLLQLKFEPWPARPHVPESLEARTLRLEREEAASQHQRRLEEAATGTKQVAVRRGRLADEFVTRVATNLYAEEERKPVGRAFRKLAASTQEAWLLVQAWRQAESAGLALEQLRERQRDARLQATEVVNNARVREGAAREAALADPHNAALWQEARAWLPNFEGWSWSGFYGELESGVLSAWNSGQRWLDGAIPLSSLTMWVALAGALVVLVGVNGFEALHLRGEKVRTARR